jgi:hypothetical protein
MGPARLDLLILSRKERPALRFPAIFDAGSDVSEPSTGNSGKHFDEDGILFIVLIHPFSRNHPDDNSESPKIQTARHVHLQERLHKRFLEH